MPDEKRLARQRQIAIRLRSLGILHDTFHYNPDYSRENYRTPLDAGRRLIILYGIAYAASHPGERTHTREWLQREGLWNDVSASEKTFLLAPEADENESIRLSWRIEAAITLGWALRVIDRLYEIDGEDADPVVEKFVDTIPDIYDSTEWFLKDLQFRNLAVVYDENMVNEYVTAYFRTCYLFNRASETTIDVNMSCERHRVLNWLRQFEGISGWDETSMAT